MLEAETAHPARPIDAHTPHDGIFDQPITGRTLPGGFVCFWLVAPGFLRLKLQLVHQ